MSKEKTETILKSKASKYKDQKWIKSNDGFTLFVSVGETDVNITLWDIKNRKQEIHSYKETETMVSKF